MTVQHTAPHTPGEYPDATRYGNHDLPALGVRYDSAPLQGIRITPDVVEFGYADDSPVSVVLLEIMLEVYQDRKFSPLTTGEWEDGVLPIDAEGIDADLALVANSEDSERGADD